MYSLFMRRVVSTALRDEERVVRRRQPLRRELRAHARAYRFYQIFALGVRFEERRRLARRLGKLRQLRRAAPKPLVVGRVAAVQQMERGERGFRKFRERERSRDGVAAFDRARIVVLSRLCHREEARGELLEPHVLGVAGEQRLAHARELA